MEKKVYVILMRHNIDVFKKLVRPDGITVPVL